MQGGIFLIDTLFNLYLMVIILRIWLQFVRADFYNPFSQFVVKATQPVVAPLRKFIPPIGPLDTSSLIFALIVAMLKLVVLASVNGVGVTQINPVTMFIFGLHTVAMEFLQLMFWILIIRAILSWISQGGNPVEVILMQLTEPMLSRIRSILPSVGGLDFSVLIAIIAVQFLMITLGGR